MTTRTTATSSLLSRIVPLAITMALFGACRARQSSIERDPSPSRPAPTASTSSSASTVAAIEVHMGTVNAYQVELEVTNVGAAPIALSTKLDVEVLGDAGWESALAKGVRLDLDCSHDACSTLAPGATVHPGSWGVAINGCIQDTCACTKGPCVIDCISVPAPSGKYRVVARACEGPTRWESAPLEVKRK